VSPHSAHIKNRITMMVRVLISEKSEAHRYESDALIICTASMGRVDCRVADNLSFDNNTDERVRVNAEVVPLTVGGAE
jgi:hypothetical protein